MQPGPQSSSPHETPPRYDTPPAPPSPRPKHLPHVISGSPAKRITFFKSGDGQFGGVRMAVHGRRFKCFDALLDDLSRKVPLPFGVRTVTTPRGTHRITCLDQLQDGGCYLCSDRRGVRPIDIEAAGKGPAAWRLSRPHSSHRRPSRPEGAPAPVTPRHPRLPKRVILVKNTDPAVRRAAIVSLRSAHSLRAFLEEASALMGCRVRRLYTLDGLKIDSVQSLMQCSSVLVCVGREPFRPLVETFRKSSAEKLPGLRNRSQSSIFSDGQESRKNDSFGLETKKSIIHPRSDSSNRSTWFSLSSDKSYPNGLNASPGNSGSAGTCPRTKGSLSNEDIEKRVVVNEDGSLSVQMRVRFHLLNDETLQWFTEIKKSAVASEGCLGKDQEPCGLQQEKSQSLSEPESISHCEVEDSTNLEASHCQDCCNGCQAYDIWKHPVHSNPALSCPAESSIPSTSSRKIVCKKESVESVRTVSCSSEEYTKHVMEKTTCIQQTAEGGDSRVEFCSISRCCSHSETCTWSPQPRDGISPEPTHSARPGSGSSVSSHKEPVSANVNGVVEIEERPTSAISNSSKVLEALREDQDEDDRASRASGRSCKHLAASNQKLQQVGSPKETTEGCKSARSMRRNGSAASASPVTHPTPRPPSKESSCSGCSLKSRTSHKPASPEPDALPQEAEQELENEKTGASSRQSSKCNGAVSETEGAQGDHQRALSSRASQASRTSDHSCCMRGQSAGEGEERSTSRTARGTQASSWSVGSLLKSEDTNGHVAEDIAVTVEERAASTMSAKSRTSAGFKTLERPLSPKSNGISEARRKRVDEDLNGKKSDSTTSSRTNWSANSQRSNCSQGDLPERALTPASATTPRETVEEVAGGMSNCTECSTSSKASTKPSAKLDYANCEDTERAASVASAKTNHSAISRKSIKSKVPADTAAPELNGDVGPLKPEKRAASALSLGSKASVKSGSSSKLICNSQEEASDRASPQATQGPDEEKVTRAVSVKSTKSQLSDSERLVTPTSTVTISIGAVKEQAASDAEERVRSAISERSQASARSTKSKGRSGRLTPKAPALPMASEPEDSPPQAGIATSASSAIDSVIEADAASSNSTSTRTRKSESERHLHVLNGRTSSAMSKASSRKSPSKHSQSARKTSGAAANAGSSSSEIESGVDAVAKEEVSSVGSRNSRSNDKAEGPRSVSKASAHSATSKSKHCITTAEKRPNSSQLRASSQLHVEGLEAKPESVNGSLRSVKTKSSKKVPINNLKVEDDSRPNSASSQDCLSTAKPKSHRHNSPAMLLGTSGDSILSNSLSATDLLRKNSRPEMGRPKSSASESMHNGATGETDCGKLANDNTSGRSCKSRARKDSSSSRQKVDDLSELVPSSLPDTSPIEVVNEWLKKIPSESSIYEVGDNFDECCKGKEAAEGQKETEDLTNDETDGNQANEGGKQQLERVDVTEKVKEESHSEEAVVPDHPETTGMAPSPESKCLIRDSFPKACHSSVQVMKVLLSSKLDRCNSLPEVSQVYGRKLSSSAKGLLDCLAQLQLVDSDPADGKAQSAKYQEVMSILQSLWLSNPPDCQPPRTKSPLKDHNPDDEYNPRSSSGVDVGCSSGESGKSMGTVDQPLKIEAVHGRITPVLEQDSQQEATEFPDPEEPSPHTLADASDLATPDIASRVQASPGGGETDTVQASPGGGETDTVQASPGGGETDTVQASPGGGETDTVQASPGGGETDTVQASPGGGETDTEEEQQDEEVGLASEQTLRSNESPKDLIETPTSSNKSSGNDSNTPNETNPQETSSEMLPSVQRAPPTRRFQDPDPVWVLSLLQKLEKQFMAHYATAMAEFKVRWDLDESVLLDTMINELKDEVHKRIQSSIHQELKKIKSRAGRGPRPPPQAVSRESTMQTAKRRQRLKGMRNKSVFSTLTRSEENLTASATDYSDQRSEDEFCPCDTCMRKKMAVRSVPPRPVNSPPVVKDFDLRKILQRKWEPPQHEQTGRLEAPAGNDAEDKNLEVVEEKLEAENEEEGEERLTHERVMENHEGLEHEEETAEEGKGKDEKENQRERGDGGGVEADGGVSGAGAPDERSRGEREEEEEQQGDVKEKQSNHVEDEKERPGDEDSIEETEGADNIKPGEEEKDFKNHLITQITKSSMESQPGSIDHCADFEPEGMADGKISSHGNSKDRSNCMYPTSSEQEATD